MSQWSNWEADQMMNEAEAHWEDPEVEPSFDRQVEEELAAALETDMRWQMQLWIIGCSKHLWTSWEVL